MTATSTGGAESALAQIDVPMNGNIIGVEWNVRAIIDTTADFQTWQLSFGSTISVANDSRQVISNVTIGQIAILTAVGAAVGQGGMYVKIPEIPVGMGERLFLHSQAAAGLVGVALLLIHFDFDLDKVQVRRR